MKGIYSYKLLIWTSLVAFLFAFIGELLALAPLKPLVWSSLGIYLCGVGFWIRLRIKKPIISPYERSSYQTSYDSILAFLFDNFLLEFWTFCLGGMMLLTLGLGENFKSQDPYLAALENLKNNPDLIQEIGTFNQTGFLVGGEIQPNFAELSLSLYGTKKGVRAYITMKKDSTTWEIDKLIIKNKKH